MTINFSQSRQCLQDFEFSNLFIQQLGWSSPSTNKSVSMQVEGETYSRKPISQLLGVVVFEITAADGDIPNATKRLAIYQEIAELVRENVLIFIDKQRTQCVWYSVKREGSKVYHRDHVYVKREPCDLLLSKVSALYVSLEELDSISVIDVAQRLQSGLDVERVTKKFYEEFKPQHGEFLNAISGINKESDRRWYTSVLLNRLMFVYFLQRQGFIDGNKMLYLQEKLEESKRRGSDLFYSNFLQVLFFEGFAKPLHERTDDVVALIGDIKYLNGGLFLKHQIEQNYLNISIPDDAFQKIFDFLARFSWNLDDTMGGKENEINPAILGYIFEKYINQKAFGAYYTRPEITEYLCDKTINKLILDRVNQVSPRKFENITELLTDLDANICRRLLEDILPNLSLLDPACGSGAFLVAAMKTLIYVYSNVIAAVKIRITDHYLNNWLKQVESKHPSLNYYIKKRIITDNLYGVDIMEEATEIAKLRLFLALVSAAHDVSELEPLPNIDFNIMAGNSLIGLIRVDETGFDAVQPTTKGKGKGKKQDSEPVDLQGNLLQPLVASNYQRILADKNASVDLYKKHAFESGEKDEGSQESRLLLLRSHIEKLNRESQEKLNLLLLDEFSTRLGIKYEDVQISGKANKRLLMVGDISALKPFHWGYHFDRVLERGGFDAIITNPPWEIFKPDAKEFFAQYSDLVTKKKMDIKAFEKEQKKLLGDADVAQAWLEYQSNFPHVSAYYRSAEQYKNQISIVNGKKAGTDINLYKLFVEQCFNLLRDNGECGIVIPSGIYTDLGTKQLREMLFSQTKVTGLFCLENRKEIFEGVDSRFKFVVLTFEKDGITSQFPSAFMRHDVQELHGFPSVDSLQITVDLVRKLSPDSLSVMEFKNEVELRIAQKIAIHPYLSEYNSGFEHIKFTRELAPDSNSEVFKTDSANNLVPLLGGRMIHQFTHRFSTTPRYWINESNARKIILGKTKDEEQKLDYQTYRVGFRKIARNTDERTMISAVMPPSLCIENLQTVQVFDEQGTQIVSFQEMVYLCAIWNSFIYDSLLRLKVSANINFFLFTVHKCLDYIQRENYSPKSYNAPPNSFVLPQNLTN